jgi:hypothetical protein
VALVLADRVKETSATTGTGALTLAGAVNGFQSFSSGIGVGNTTFYVIVLQGGTEWEVGIGTLSAGTTLTRDSVISSSNAGALVAFSAGVKDVFVSSPSARSVMGDDGMVFNQQSIDRDVTIPAGYNALSAGPVTIATGKTVTVPSGSVWSIV